MKEKQTLCALGLSREKEKERRSSL